MREEVLVLKDADNQRPVPSVWRSTLYDIVEALKDGDFSLARGVAGVRPIHAKNAIRIANNIRGYGARLASLQEDAWRTSACQWMRSYWDVLVDLSTVEEGASDLALDVRVYEEGSGYIFEVQSVHVP